MKTKSAKSCLGGQIAVREKFLRLTNRKNYKEMCKSQIVVELAEILPMILQEEEVSSILKEMVEIPIEKLPNRQTEKWMGKTILLEKIGVHETLSESVRLLIWTKSGRIIISNGVLTEEGNVSHLFSEYIHKFADAFANV